MYFDDKWKTIKAPSAKELLDNYSRLVYACATQNAQAVAATPIRLYSLAGSSKRVTKQAAARITKGINSADADEVTDHPLLDVLEKANPFMDGNSLQLFTSLYMDVAGVSYWHLEKTITDGAPFAAWLLQPNLVTVKRGQSGMPESYEYGSNPKKRQTFAAADIVPFRMPNLLDPYCGSWSPARASWDCISLINSHVSYQYALIENRARPDVVLSPKEPSTASIMGRMVDIFNRGLRRNRNGGAVALPNSVDVTTLNVSSRDMEMLKLSEFTRREVMNIFGIPPALFDSNKSRAELEAALVQHARLSILPRVLRRDEILNQFFVSQFGDERLFLASDNPVIDDEERNARIRDIRLKDNLTTINEERAMENMEPVEWGDEPGQSGTAITVSTQEPMQDGGDGIDVPMQEADQEKAALLSMAGGITGMIAINQSVTAGAMDYEPALATVMLFFGVSREEAQALVTKPSDKPETVSPASVAPAAEPDAKPDAKGFKARSSTDMVRFLKKWFKAQKATILDAIKTKGVGDESKVPDLDADEQAWKDYMEKWNEDMAKEYAPLFSEHADASGTATAKRLRMPDAWSVTDPNTAKALSKSAYKGMASVNQFTGQSLCSRLATEMTEGDNTLASLTRAVEGVFIDGETWRAKQIAATESSRAVHDAQIMTAEESGIVVGFEPLISSDACSVCQAWAAETKMISLEDAKKMVGIFDREVPPIHPNCMCTITEKLS